MQRQVSLIDRYRDRLPLKPGTQAISLIEGSTPLIQLQHIDAFNQHALNVYVKYEGANPTGSFKDRGMTVAVSQAVAKGSNAIICASTGNTSAAAAAYAARAGIKAYVLIPEGKIAMGKLAQALMYDATIIQIEGNFDDGMQLVKQVGKELPITIVNSINPYRLQGQKTAAFEIVDELGQAPDYHYLPVGNAGNISAYWMGYTEYHQDGIMDKRPVMVGYQASGAAPFIHGQPILQPETIATAIRIGNPQSWQLAIEAQQQSKGWFASRDDSDIIAAQQLLAAKEGIFCEPASAISIAGLLNDVALGKVAKGSCCVCTLTGNGLKDPDAATHKQQQLHTVKAEFNAIKAVLSP